MILIAKTQFHDRMLLDKSRDFGYDGDKVNKTKHQYYVFLTIIETHTLALMLEHFKINVSVIEKNGEYNLCLISASIEDWKSIIIKAFSDENISKDISLNRTIEGAYNFFKNEEKLDFLWADFSKKRSNIGLLEFKGK